MKLCVGIISLVLCLSLVMAQNDCSIGCHADLSPVCGEAMVGGQLVRCEFPNACSMGVSACTKKIGKLVFNYLVNFVTSICILNSLIFN